MNDIAELHWLVRVPSAPKRWSVHKSRREARAYAKQHNGHVYELRRSRK